MFILRKVIQAIAGKARHCNALSSDDSEDTSEYDEVWSIQRDANESEHSTLMEHFRHELKEQPSPALVDDESDGPHLLAGAETEEYFDVYYGFEYLSPEPKVREASACTASDAEKESPPLDFAERWADLSDDLLSFRVEPPCEDIFETYLRNKRELVTIGAVDNPSTSRSFMSPPFKSMRSKKRNRQVKFAGPVLEAALAQMIFEPSTVHHRPA